MTTSVLRSILSNNGFYEHYSNSLISAKEQEYFSSSSAIMISNPLNQNMKYIRNSMLPGLLKAVSYNQNRQNRNYKLFEIGAIYYSSNKKIPDEKTYLGIAWPSIKYHHWKNNQDRSAC